MPIVAYTSSQAAPIGAQVDKVYDLAVTALPVATLQLFGDAVDSGDPGAVWTWQWVLLDKPAGSAASFLDATAQNAVLQNLDVWGNYLVLLVATNTNTGLTSEPNPLKAPATARNTTRMQSAKAALEKLAAGERSWHTRFRAAVQVIEDLKNASVGAHTINSHTDAGIATGADLVRLVNGSYAHQGGNPANPGMHKHVGAHVDVATTVLKGVVLLEDSPADPANPKAITQERMIYQGNFDGTQTALGYSPGIVEPPAAGPWSRAHCIWFFPYAVEVQRFDVFLGDGGDGGDYEFRLESGNLGDVTLNTTAIVTDGFGNDAEVFGPAALPHAPILLAKGGPWSIAASTYVVLRCTSAPPTLGGQGSVQIHALRKV